MSSKLSRRSFLKGAAALAAASAASGVLAGCSSTGVNGGAVSGTGAVRTFTDGETTITITSMNVDVLSVAGDSLMKVVPTFKVENKTKSAITFVGSANKIEDTGYTMVVAACFDGKLPEAEPVKATVKDPSLGLEITIIGTDLTDFTQTAVSANDTAEGALVFDAPFKNWEQMVVTLTLCKKDADGGTVEIGTAAYTFRQ